MQIAFINRSVLRWHNTLEGVTYGPRIRLLAARRPDLRHVKFAITKDEDGLHVEDRLG